MLAAAVSAGRVASLVSGPAAESVVVAVFAVVLLEAASLPFSVLGWRASRRVGLSRQTAAGWAADHAKGLALGMVLIVPAAVVVTLLQRRAPAAWPLLVWLVATLMSLVVTILAPVVILPLFLRAERLESGALWQMTRDVCARAGVAVDDVRLLAMSEKTSGANAAVVGIGPTRRILLGDTLVDSDDLAETRAVLAHELAHHKHHDMWRGLVVEAC